MTQTTLCCEIANYDVPIKNVYLQKNYESNKFVFGQYFTKKEMTDVLVNLLLKYKIYPKDINILEPSSGTGNFITSLQNKGFTNVQDCEIDPKLTSNPQDFFLLSLNKKFDLIIGNPPFTKYNVKESYYYPEEYTKTKIHPEEYLSLELINKNKLQIENAFILKSIKHLKNEHSTLSFVLPISFFIKGKNKEVKKAISKRFSTIIIYQNDKNWFEEPIPCCFAIFTDINKYKNKIILLYENEERVEEYLDKTALLNEELIPQSFLYKKNNHIEGTPLAEFLSNENIKYNKDCYKNNISAANIMEKNRISNDKNIEKYQLAVTRVGNASVGKTGLIDTKKDVLNDMFYVFSFKEKYNKNKELKEKICKLINENQKHIRNLTIRVGSKSIKKSDILDLRVKI